VIGVAVKSLSEPGIISTIVAKAVKCELDRATEWLKEAGKPVHTDQGFEMIWKIAHRASVKPNKMREHWRALLRSAMDKDYPHEIRTEDVDFLDSLNPADVFMIDLLFNHGEEVRGQHANSGVLSHIRNALGQGKGDIDGAISNGFLEAKLLIKIHHLISGSQSGFGWEELGATMQNRSRDLLASGSQDMAVLEVYGGIRQGVFHVYVPEDKNRNFSYRLGSSDYPEIFCIGGLTPQSRRLAKLLGAAKSASVR